MHTFVTPISTVLVDGVPHRTRGSTSTYVCRILSSSSVPVLPSQPKCSVRDGMAWNGIAK